LRAEKGRKKSQSNGVWKRETRNERDTRKASALRTTFPFTVNWKKRGGGSPPRKQKDTFICWGMALRQIKESGPGSDGILAWRTKSPGLRGCKDTWPGKYWKGASDWSVNHEGNSKSALKKFDQLGPYEKEGRGVQRSASPCRRGGGGKPIQGTIEENQRTKREAEEGKTNGWAGEGRGRGKLRGGETLWWAFLLAALRRTGEKNK